MENVGQWRLIEPENAETASAAPQDEAPTRRTSFVLIAATVALLVAAVGVAIWATLPAGGAAVEQADDGLGDLFRPLSGEGDSAGLPVVAVASDAPSPQVVVDVQGAVANPGVHGLPGGSRVADAIEAAGGYAPNVDIAAASRQLNLAEKLVDGTQLHVPALGEAAEMSSPPPQGAISPGAGLINLNSATPEELDTLPGIGPVTAAKIIDARAEAPFAAVDDLLARGVVGASTFENIRDLVTV